MATENIQNSPTRPNFFVLLGLNPHVPWDQAVFERVLGEKQRAWSVQQNKVGKIALESKKNLAYFGQIKVVMADEKLRQAEAAAALVILAAEREAKKGEFEKQLSFINAKDSIEQAELDKFIDDFQDIYSAAEVRNRVKVKVAPSGSHSTSPDQLLDPSVFKNIVDLLSIVKKSSLYDLLQLSDATATAQLRAAAAELYKNVVGRLTKTAEVTALNELAGLAKTIFQSEEMRQRYDANLRRASLDLLLTDLDMVMNRAVTKEVQAGQVNLFLENAQKAGWKRDEAYNRLKEHVRQRKWSLAPTEVEAKIRCRNCSRLNARDRKLCSECGQPLYDTCPDCGQQVPCEDRVCNNCGFAVGNRYMIENHFAELDELFKDGDFEKARGILQILLDAWKPKTSDNRLERINAYNDKLAQIEQQQQQVQKEKEIHLQVLISHKKLIEARSFLQKHSAEIPNREEIQHSIDMSISKAQDLLKTLRNTRSPDDRITIQREVEDICIGLPGYIKEPPSPPSNLQANVRGTTVSLAWNPSTTPNVFYTIVCKSSAQPNTITDGKKVSSNVTGCTYDDAAATIGVPLYYAVFSGYDTMRSVQAALLNQSVLVMQSVLSATVRVDNQQVDLSWETPPNVHSVAVVRKEQTPPAAISDGVRIGDYRPSQKQLTDRNVRNEQTYYYALYCQFRDHAGRLVLSPGEFISATPQTPPQPIHHLDIKSTRLDQGYEITISWKQPDKGYVIIMKTDKPFALSTGKVVPQADLITYGQKLEQWPDSVTEKWAKMGMAYYTPVITFQEMAYVGTSQPFVCVDNISNLRCQNIGTAIRFHWRWPENCQEVLITYSMEGWHDPNKVTRRVNFAEYDRVGHYDLRGTVDQDYYMEISAVINQDGTNITSEVIRKQVRQAKVLELTYEIKNPTMLRRKRTLHITSRTSGTIPAMVLVGKRDRLPFKKTDGDLLQHIASRLIRDGEVVVIDLSERTYPQRTYGKLFLEDDSMNATVVIRQPDESKVRLS